MAILFSPQALNAFAKFNVAKLRKEDDSALTAAAKKNNFVAHAMVNFLRANVSVSVGSAVTMMNSCRTKSSGPFWRRSPRRTNVSPT